MPHVIRSIIVAATAAFAFVPLATVHAQATNALEFTIGGGPHAGTYKVGPDVLMCVRLKDANQVAATFKDFAAHDPNKLSEGGIEVDNPDKPGTRTGHIVVHFGDSDKSGTQYDVSIPSDSKGPLTLTPVAKGGTMTFEGRTKNGIPVRVTAKCGTFEAL